MSTSSSGLPALTDTSRWYPAKGASFNTSQTVFTILCTSSSSSSTARDSNLRTSETTIAGSLKNIALGCNVLAERQWRGSGAECGVVMTTVPSAWGGANCWIAKVCKRHNMSAEESFIASQLNRELTQRQRQKNYVVSEQNNREIKHNIYVKRYTWNGIRETANAKRWLAACH